MHRLQVEFARFRRAIAFVFALTLALQLGAVTVVGVGTAHAAIDATASDADMQTAAAGDAQESLEDVWFGLADEAAAQGIETRRRSLEIGLPNLEIAARALIARPDPQDALTNRMLAVRLAPDLPLAHIALASAFFDVGEYRQAITQVVLAAFAVPSNLEATAWLLGTLLMMFAVVLVASTLVFVAVVGLSKAPNAAHDLGDLISRSMPSFARAALLTAVVLLPFALGEGVLGLALGLFCVGFVYAGQQQRMVLASAILLFVLGAFPVLQISGIVLRALDADPIASASLAVLRGSENAAQVALLKQAAGQEDVMAAEIMALRARRSGDDMIAQSRFEMLLEIDPASLMALTGLGNIAYRAGQNDLAIEYYERGLAIADAPILLYDLAQAYATAFRMEESDVTMARAQAEGSGVIAELLRFGESRVVADLPYPVAPIRNRMLAAADGGSFTTSLMTALAPGYLGKNWMHTGGGFVLAALIALILSARYQHAGRCQRCGSRICARCDDSMWSSELCDGCHHLFNRPQGTDPDLRMARLKALRERETKIEKLVTAASFMLPGAAGLLARRPDLSFMGLLLFFWTLVLFAWRGGVVPEPLVLGAVGPLAFILAGCVMALLYVGVLITGLMIRRSL
jgi:tetratricopeptide (TPR) repeat protein